jgi:hypothetical protein
MADLTINKVELKPEIIDDFRLNFGQEASDYLAKDLVNTFSVDFADQIQEDPNFFNYDLIKSGKATFFDQLSPQYTMEVNGEQKPIRDMLPAERAVRFQNPDAISALLSNAEIGSLPGAFFSEFFKTAPSVAAGTKAAQMTAARTFRKPPTSILQFGLQAAPPLAAFIGSGMLLYEGADALEEGIFGPDVPILPGQKANVEMVRTLGGGTAGIQFPFLMKQFTNRAARDFIANLAEDASAPVATRMTAAIENMIEGMGRSAKASKVGAGLTVLGEAVPVLGSGVGARYAEATYPGQTGPRLASELIGGNTFAATLSKLMPKAYNIVKENGDAGDVLIGKVATGKQRKLFNRMNELFELHGGNYEKMMADLNNAETRAILSEVFPDVEFTAGQRLEDDTGLLMMVEAAMAKQNPELMATKMKADRNAKEFFDNWIKGLISEGSQDALKTAAVLRRGMFDDALKTRLTAAVDARIKAAQQLLKGPINERSQQAFSGMLADTIDSQLELARRREKALWDKVGRFTVFNPQEIIEGSVTPSFILKYDELLQDILPEYRDEFIAAAPALHKTVQNMKQRLGLDIRQGIAEQKGVISRLTRQDADSVNALNTLINQEAGEGASLSNRLAAAKKISSQLEDKSKFAMLYGNRFTNAQKSTMLPAARAQAKILELEIAKADPSRVSPVTADELVKLRREVLNDASNLYSGATTRRGTANQARQFGEIAEAILDDMNTVEDGVNDAYDVARSYSAALNDVYTRSIVGKARAETAMGARRIPPELLTQQFIRGNPDVTDLRIQELQGIAEFAQEQGFEGATKTFTTINNIMESAIRDARKKSVFPPGHSREGQVNADALARWKQENAETLSRFPALEQDLDNAIAAQRTFEVYDARSAESKKLADSQSYLAGLIGNSSPTAAISEAMNFVPKKGTVKDPVGGLKRLFRLTTVKYRGPDGKLLPKEEQDAIRAKINEGFENAILQYAFMNAGGESIKTFDPITFHKIMFSPVKGQGAGLSGGSQSLVDIAKQYGIMDKNQITRMRTISNQMVRLAAADAAGKLDDPELIQQAGPIFDFYVGMVGLAGGSKAYKALMGGESGTGAISAAAAGKRFILDMFKHNPSSKRMEAMQMLFADPELAATLLRPATNAKQKQNQLSRIQRILSDKGFEVAAGQSPYIIREMYEDEDRGTGITREEMLERMGLSDDQSSVRPELLQPNNLPSQPAAPTTSVASAAPVQPRPITPPPAASGPVDRSRYAAMFPTDIASGLIRQGQGIGSLMG